jgi:hypothetical protein
MKKLIYIIAIACGLGVAFTAFGAQTVCSVFQGCTGVGSFGQGWVYSAGGTGNLAASTSPTVNYITATSTTATSTFANGINITKGCFAKNGVCLSTGSATTPGGSNTQVQFNDSGAFGGDADFTWNKNTDTLGFASFVTVTPLDGIYFSSGSFQWQGTNANDSDNYVIMRAGTGASGSSGGDFLLSTGNGGAGSGGAGGAFSITTGNGTNDHNGGDFSISTGLGNSSGVGGSIYLTPAAGGKVITTYASTTALSATTLCLSTDCRTAWPSGGGGGAGNISTSSAETSGLIPFWTTTGATPAALSGGDAGLAWSTSASRLTTTYASSTGLTATSLFGTNLALTGSSTLRNYTGVNGTTTNATSTSLYSDIVRGVTGVFTNLSATKLSNLTSNGFVKTSGSDGTLSVDTNTYLTGNQTITLSGDVSGSGSTAITTTYNGTVPIAKGGTNATSFSTSGNSVYYNGTSLLTAPLTSAVTTPYASSTALSATGLIQAGNILATGSTTLQNYTGLKATTTSATSTVSLYSPLLTATTICLTGDTCKTAWPTGGSGTYPFTPTLNFNNIVTSATTSPLWLQGSPYSLMASSTALMTEIGIGTTTPWGQIGIKDTAPAFTLSTASDYGRFYLDGGGDVNFTKQYTCATCGYSFENSTNNQTFFVADTGQVSLNNNYGADAAGLEIFTVSNQQAYANPGDFSQYALLLNGDTSFPLKTNTVGVALSPDGQNVTASIVAATTSTQGEGALHFFTKQNTTPNGAPTEALTLSDAGKVGISSTSPMYGLTVNNTIYSSVPWTGTTSLVPTIVPPGGDSNILFWDSTKGAFWAQEVESNITSSSIGNASAAFGENNRAGGYGAFTAGRNNTVNSTDGIGVGLGNTLSSGTSNGAFGSNNTVSNDNGFALGSNNTVANLYGFAAGNANNTGTQDEAFAIGFSNVAQGNNSGALGNNNDVLDDVFGTHPQDSIAIGSGNLISTPQSYGIGVNVFLRDDVAGTGINVGIGNNLMASGTKDVIIGSGASSANKMAITGNNIVALGANSDKPTLILTGASGVGTWGNVGIGATTTPAARLSVSSFNDGVKPQFLVASSTGSGATTTSFLIDRTGAIFAPNTTASASTQTGYWCYDTSGQLIRDTTTCLVSASKFKKDVTPINAGLAEILKLRPVNYYLKDAQGDANNKVQQFGFIAEEAEKVDARLVTHDSNGDIHSFRYEQFTAVLTKSVQDLYGQLQKLVGRVSGLENKLNKQQQQIDSLQKQINELKHK